VAGATGVRGPAFAAARIGIPELRLGAFDGKTMTYPVSAELPYRVEAIGSSAGRGKGRCAGQLAPHANRIAQSPEAFVLAAVPGICNCGRSDAALTKHRTARHN